MSHADLGGYGRLDLNEITSGDGEIKCSTSFLDQDLHAMR